MKSVLKFFATNHILSYLVTIMVFLIGTVVLLQINRSEYPEVVLGEVNITTIYPGASPEDVELNVTNKIEDEIKGISGIKEITSTSMENISTINVIIDPDEKDKEQVKTEIREAVARVTDLPPEVTKKPEIEIPSTNSIPIIEIGMTSEVLSYAELREYARKFEKKLKQVQGISTIKKQGYRAREIHIEVSPEKLADYSVSIQDITQAIQGRNIRMAGGSVESYTSEKNVVTLAQFRDPKEVGDVIIRSTFDGQKVRVKDLAIINDDFTTERIIPLINGKKAISFIITKKASADLIKTVDQIKELIEDEAQYLPDSIEFLYSNDTSLNIKNKISIVRSNALFGLIFVLIVLALFLNIRSSFWVAMGIPFSILGTIALLPLFGVELDSITLSSMVLVLGIIVDDAIVIAENIFKRREKGDTPLQAAVNGVHEVYKPVLTTIITTFLAFLPMFFMSGELGQFIKVIPLTITLALSLSLIESFFILPAHIAPGLKRKSGSSFGRSWFKPVEVFFEKVMFHILKLRYLVVLLAVAILAGSLFFAATKLNFVLFPSKGANAFHAMVELPLGTSLDANRDKMKELEAIINEIGAKELESYILTVGISGSAGDHTQGENYSTFSVSLTPYGSRKRSADQIVEEVRKKFDQIEGLNDVIFAIDTSSGPPSGKPIQIMAIGADNTIRQKLVEDIMDFLKKMEGVKDVDRDNKPGKEEVLIKLNYDNLARYGLNVSQIAQNVRIAYDGQAVTSIRYGEEDVDFRVRYNSSFRKNIKHLKNLRISNNQGRLVSLQDVAYLEIGPGKSVLNHFDGERSTIVSGDLDQDITTSLQVNQAVLSHFTPILSRDYPGMRLMMGGEGAESEEAVVNLMFTFLLAAVGIYFLLILLFRSFTQPIMVLLSIPFGISGVIIALGLHNEPLSFLGMLGIIGMAGVVVNDSLVLVNHLNELKKSGEKTNIRALIAHGTAHRLRPIMLTTVTTVAGLLPLAYGLGGQDIYMMPMALSLGFGLLFATPVTLILIPSLYTIGEDIGGLFRKIFKKPAV